MIPHDLNKSQKIKRFQICYLHLIRHERNQFLSQIATLISYDDRKRLAQWLDYDKAQRHFQAYIVSKKVMVTGWLSDKGVILSTKINFRQQ